MRRSWSSTDVVTSPGVNAELTDCVRASRLLGADPYLVLHGGGNSSAKIGRTIYVKASGHDLRTIGPDGFAPLDRAALDLLLAADAMTDAEMSAGLRAALLDPTSADPSIETLLHNLLPFPSVLHTHADPIVTLTNTADADRILAEVFGSDVLVLPYSMPGFELAKLVQREWARLDGRDVVGIVLAHHGLFTFGDTPEEAYGRQLELIERAERFIAENTGVEFADDPHERELGWEQATPALVALAERVSAVAGMPMIASALSSPEISRFLARPDVATITQCGPSTLEHVIRTKRVPLIGHDVDAFERAYTRYFERNRGRSNQPLTMLDPAPRIILDADLGIVTFGRTEKELRIAQDIYRHTIRVIAAAQALGGYTTITESQAFDIEYWELEQAKLSRRRPEPSPEPKD